MLFVFVMVSFFRNCTLYLFRYIQLIQTTDLDNGRVLVHAARGFGWLADSQVFDVTATEDDVLEDLIPGWYGPLSRTVFGTEGTNCRG